MKKRTGILLALCLALLGVLFVNPKGVSAANGPCKDEASFANIQTEGEVIGVDQWGYEEKIYNYIYMSDYMKKNNINYTTNIPKGISYNEKTNTLTLNNYTGKEISCNMMGDDFKLELKGENTLEMLYIWSDYYGGSITITGDGVLNVKGGYDDRESLYGSSGIKVFTEDMGASSFFKVTDNATVNVESDGSYNYYLVGVYMTMKEKNGIDLDGVKLSGGLLSGDTTQLESQVQRKTENGLYNTYYTVLKKGGKQYLCQSRGDWNLETGESTSYVIVYSDAETPKEITRYADYDEVRAAGYEFEYYDVYNYSIIGKHCTISAKADTTIKKDDVVSVDNMVYGIKTVGTKKKAGTVYVVGINDYEKEKTTVTIPKTIKVDGITYKVTGIGKYAFNYDSKMEKVIIGANVKYIEEQAFYSSSLLKDIVIKSKKLTSKTVGKDAFGEIGNKVTVTAPSKKLSSYKKVLTAKGLSKDTVFKKG